MSSRICSIKFQAQGSRLIFSSWPFTDFSPENYWRDWTELNWTSMYCWKPYVLTAFTVCHKHCNRTISGEFVLEMWNFCESRNKFRAICRTSSNVDVVLHQPINDVPFRCSLWSTWRQNLFSAEKKHNGEHSTCNAQKSLTSYRPIGKTGRLP